MKKFFSLVPVCFFFISCAGNPSFAGLTEITGKIFGNTAPAEEPVVESSFQTLPVNNSLVFLGIAGRRSNPNETIRFALEDAARRVAVYHKVSGEYLAETSVGSGAFDYSNNVRTALYYDREGAAQYVDSLTFDADTDVFETDNTCIIRAAYNAALPNPVNYRPVYTGDSKKPDWVDNPSLRIDGYEVGIGYAGRHSTLASTCLVSYDNAIFAIIRNLSVISRNVDIQFQGSGLFDYKTSNDHLIYAAGSLDFFYVLDTWIDPSNKSVWTLAIARKSE